MVFISSLKETTTKEHVNVPSGQQEVLLLPSYLCKLLKSGPPPWKFPEISAPLKSNPGFCKRAEREIERQARPSPDQLLNEWCLFLISKWIISSVLYQRVELLPQNRWTKTVSSPGELINAEMCGRSADFVRQLQLCSVLLLQKQAKV